MRGGDVDAVSAITDARDPRQARRRYDRAIWMKELRDTVGAADLPSFQFDSAEEHGRDGRYDDKIGGMEKSLKCGNVDQSQLQDDG